MMVMDCHRKAMEKAVAIIRDILTTKNFVTKVEWIFTLILIVRKDGAKQ